MRYQILCRLSSFRAIFALAIAALAACDRANQAFEQAVSTDEAREENSPFQYDREFVFLAASADGPLVVPFDFSARERGDEIERGVRAWLARGTVWDRFLDESTRTTNAGGVWKVVPISDVRLNVGGATQIETIRFDRGERQLRLELDSPLSEWQQGDESRFRLLRGRVIIGPEVVPGSVLELLRYERTLEDGWPPGQDFDAVFLSTGDSIQMLIAETLSGDGNGEGYAWIHTPSGERTWENGELRWLEVRTYENARRDIPARWSFRVPGADVSGELVAEGFDAILGPERGGRKAVEIRYTVSGSIEIGGVRRDVVGAIRHTQQ